jgi:hypothetical protein
MSPGKWLKSIGFFINIFAALYLVFEGNKLSIFADCVRGKKPWKTFTEYPLSDWIKTRETAIIVSALVIIGSSLQEAGDLIDP